MFTCVWTYQHTHIQRTFHVYLQWSVDDWIDGWLVGWLDGGILFWNTEYKTHTEYIDLYTYRRKTVNFSFTFWYAVLCSALRSFVRWVYEILLISRYSAPANSLNNALERNGTCLKKPRLEERISYRKENGKLFFLFSCSFFSSIEKTHNSRFNKKIKANNWDCQLKKWKLKSFSQRAREYKGKRVCVVKRYSNSGNSWKIYL